MTGPRYREGQQIALGTQHGQLRRLRAGLLVVAVFAAVGMAAGAYGTVSARTAAEDNCVRIHRIVVAGGELIGSPKELREMRDRGRITQRQYEKALGWYSADCPLPPAPEHTPARPTATR